MPVRVRTIEKEAEKEVVVMAGHHRLDEVMRVFFEQEYAANKAYLLVCEADGQVGVMSFLELAYLRAKVGPNLAEIRLAEWPMPAGSRVFVNEEIKSGRDVTEWVARHPTSRGVVVDKLGQFVCLFTNPNRSGSPFGSSLPRLHGILTNLRTDRRRMRQSNVEKPVCRYCKHQDFYAIKDKHLVCKNEECGKVMGEL